MGYLFKATSINVARAIYALNWFDIAPGLTYISGDLNLRIVQLGIATTFFYVGLAPFQLIGGAIASRIGSRKVAVIGLILLGIGAILSGASNNLLELSLSRFVAGWVLHSSSHLAYLSYVTSLHLRHIQCRLEYIMVCSAWDQVPVPLDGSL